MSNNRRLCNPLRDNHRAFLAEEITRLVPRARDSGDPMARVARLLIDSLLWCWTADGIGPDGNAVRDGIKYDLRHQRHTAQARFLWEANGCRGSGLRHEHAVPKVVLLQHLLTLEQPSPASVQEILTRFCFAVIVTRSEDDILNQKGFRDAMPSDWSFSGSDCHPMARYTACELADLVRMPLSGDGAAG